MSAIAIPLNPFADQIVTTPRHTEPSVKGLNDQVLRRLMAEFEKMEAPPRRGGRAQLVVSPAGGYGKSHLIGRLFRDVGRRATRVYVRPFTAPETCWISLLQSIVQELTLPEFEDGTDRGQFPPTQLDAFAHGVLGSLLVGLMDKGEFSYSDPAFVRHRLTNQTFEKWDLSSPQSTWGAWAADTLDAFEKSQTRAPRMLALFEEITQNGLSSNTRPQAWLRVLRSFCQDRADGATRGLALEWVRARTSRAPETTEPLGLVAADGEDQSIGASVRNATARARVLDLMVLARLARPFLLCFDQTEVYGRVPGLAKAFGSLLSDLVQGEGAHLTVVTANNDVWEHKLLPEMERADHDRIAPRVEMLGLTREQGRELALQRLKQTRLPADLQETVLAADWLNAQFSVGLLAPREFLRRCERRYEDVVPAAPAQAAKPEMMLVELFAREKKRLLEDPRDLSEYRGEVLRWALQEIPRCVGSGFAASAFGGGPVSFVTEWRGDETKRWLIVLEDGSNALNWRAVAARAVELHSESAGTTALAIRIEQQPEVPDENWGANKVALEQAVAAGALRIVKVAPEVLASVYAVWELYTQACQDDIPHDPDTVMRFAAQRLQSWYATLRGEKTMEETHDAAKSVQVPAPPVIPPPPAPNVPPPPQSPPQPQPLPKAVPAPAAAKAPSTGTAPVAIPAPPVAAKPAPAPVANRPVAPPKAKPVPPPGGVPKPGAPAPKPSGVSPAPAKPASAAPKPFPPPANPTKPAKPAGVSPKPLPAPAVSGGQAAKAPKPAVSAATQPVQVIAEPERTATQPTVVTAGALKEMVSRTSEPPNGGAPSTNGGEGPRPLEECVRQVVKNRRFASYMEIAEELQARAGRKVTLEEATAAAEATGEIRVYDQGANAGFLWQGW